MDDLVAMVLQGRAVAVKTRIHTSRKMMASLESGLDDALGSVAASTRRISTVVKRVRDRGGRCGSRSPMGLACYGARPVAWFTPLSVISFDTYRGGKKITSTRQQ